MLSQRFLKNLGLQGEVPNVSAGNWFQHFMRLCFW